MTGISNKTAMLKALDLALGRVDMIWNVLAEDPKKIMEKVRSQRRMEEEPKKSDN